MSCFICGAPLEGLICGYAKQTNAYMLCCSCIKTLLKLWRCRGSPVTLKKCATCYAHSCTIRTRLTVMSKLGIDKIPQRNLLQIDINTNKLVGCVRVLFKFLYLIKKLLEK